MSKALSPFTTIPDQPEIWSAQKGGLRCTALRLSDGSLCLYSPVLGLDDAAKASLASLGAVTFLLAPNHYHHKGLKEYAQAFPDATIVCSDKARPRLEKQTGLTFGGLDSVTPHLPQGCRMVEPDGLKTGEVWFVLKTAHACAWIVCDSFKGPAGDVGHVGQTVEMLGTFPKFGIKHGKAYAAWIEVRAAADAPTLIIPCHGSLIRGADLASDVVSLLIG